MNREEFASSLKMRATKDLLKLVKSNQTGGSSIHPDFFSCIINELKSRKLSELEAKEFENLANLLLSNKIMSEPQNSKIINQMDNKYKVVPFNPSSDIPSSLQEIIYSEAVSGWRYLNHEYSDKLKPGSSGCFGIGSTPDSTIHVGFVIFERD